MPEARSRMRCESRPKIGHSTASGAHAQLPERGEARRLDAFAQLAAEAGQAAHRERIEHRAQVVRRDDGEAVGLLELGGDLGHQLVRRHAHRGRRAAWWRESAA